MSNEVYVWVYEYFVILGIYDETLDLEKEGGGCIYSKVVVMKFL